MKRSSGSSSGIGCTNPGKNGSNKSRNDGSCGGFMWVGDGASDDLITTANQVKAKHQTESAN